MTEELGFLPHWPGTAEATNGDAFDEDVLESPIPVLVEAVGGAPLSSSCW